MAKRFFYMSAGFMMLALAYHFIAGEAFGQNGSYFRVTYPGVVVVGDHAYHIGGNAQTGYGWSEISAAQLPPVPLSSCVQFNECVTITEAGEGFVAPQCNGDWVSVGTIPGGTVGVQGKEWGSLKNKYRK